MTEDLDLRHWIKRLEDEGRLARVTAPVDLRGELAVVVRKTLNAQGPALLFENMVDDYQGERWCKRLFTNGLGNRAHVALMFGEHPDTPRRELIKRFRHAINNPIDPVIIPAGEAPVKENIRTGKDIDLNAIPVPHWHPLDRGRYINTWCGVVTKDPETGWINVGMYRGMIAGPDEISVLLLHSQQWGIHLAKYAERRQRMPVAVVYGYDETLGFTAGAQLPVGLSEYGVMGAIRKRPVPLVKCETSDLLVPAFAEIVVEGYIDTRPSAMKEEGPFGEYTGYYGGTTRPRYTLKVEAITHRNDPIYRGSLEGAGPGEPNEDSHLYAVASKAIMFEILERAGVPGVIDVRPGPVNIVKVRQAYRGHAKQVAAALWGSWAAEWMFKVVMVVDEDIDIYNERNLQWAFCYRVDPAQDDIVIFPDNRGGSLDPSTPEAEKNDVLYGTGRWDRVLIDALRSIDTGWRDEWGRLRWPPLSTAVPKDVDEQVQRRWSEYGIPVEARPARTVED